MSDKISTTLYEDDPFTGREILLLKEAVEKLPTNYSSEYFEIEKHEVLKKIAALSWVDNSKNQPMSS